MSYSTSLNGVGVIGASRRPLITIRMLQVLER